MGLSTMMNNNNNNSSSSPTPSIDSLNGLPGSGSAASSASGCGSTSSRNGDHSSASSAESGLGGHSITSNTTLSNGIGVNGVIGSGNHHGSSASSSGLGSSPQLRSLANLMSGLHQNNGCSNGSNHPLAAGGGLFSDFGGGIFENGLNSTANGLSSNCGADAVGGVISCGSVSALCANCKGRECVARCKGCANSMCTGCVITHQCMHNGFDLTNSLGGLSTSDSDLDALSHLVQDSKNKAQDLRASLKGCEQNSARLNSHFVKAQNEVNETFSFFNTLLEERKSEVMRDLDAAYANKQLVLSMYGQKAHDTVDKIYQTTEILDRLLKRASSNEIVLLKRPIEQKYQSLVTAFNDTVLASSAANLENLADFDFVQPSFAIIQNAVKNNFGFVRNRNNSNGSNGSNGSSNGHNAQQDVMQQRQPPICRPISSSSHSLNNGLNNFSSNLSGLLNGQQQQQQQLASFGGGHHSLLERSRSQQPTPPVSQYQLNSFVDDSLLSKRFSRPALGPLGVSELSNNGHNSANPYEKWSNGNDSKQLLFSNGHDEQQQQPLLDQLSSSKLLNQTPIFPPKSQIKRQKMIYRCKFGEFGVLEGQFTEPSGVAVNAQNDIIVADTNNHRIQIFDKEGRFKFQFGECGKRDGQLLYPNRVAVVRQSGDIIVTERSPTHQVQIYNQYGQFVRKFGANILQHPRGVCVDNKGRIIVVECKVMRVIIFDQMGNVLNKFGCSKHLEFPNGVVVNDRQEIFISDNRAHCVKVFNYEGSYLRQIGGEGITNYPIGVGINAAGEVTIADNHNNFNLSVFSQEGNLLSALESKVKHAQCFDVSLMDDGSVVLASKDYRLYIYRYVQVSNMGV